MDAKDKTGEVEGCSIEVYLRAGVFERFDKVRCMRGEDYSCDERDHYVVLADVTVPKERAVTSFREVEFLFEQVGNESEESDESAKY